MTRISNKTLDADDTFPTIQLNMIDGSTLNFPDDAGKDHSVLLVYRGAW